MVKEYTLEELDAVDETGSSSTHASKSPSDASRWSECTAAMAYCRLHDLKKSAGAAAKEGTRAHTASQIILEQLIYHKKQWGELPTFPSEISEGIEPYVNECYDLVEDDSITIVEAQVPLFYSPTETGTVDFNSFCPSKNTLYIRDLKFGKHVRVNSVENKQLAIYALSFVEATMDLLDINKDTVVDIAAVQPRMSGDCEPWVLTVEELTLFCEPLRRAAETIDSGIGLKFAPSESACRWCPAAKHGACYVRNAEALKGMPADPEPDLHKILGIEDQVKLFKRSKDITKLLSNIGESLNALASSGDMPEGLKYAKGRRGNLSWRTEEEAIEFMKRMNVLEENMFKKTVITPTQTKKILGDSTMEEAETEGVVFRPEAKQILVASDDARPELDFLEDMPTI